MNKERAKQELERLKEVSKRFLEQNNFREFKNVVTDKSERIMIGKECFYLSPKVQQALDIAIESLQLQDKLLNAFEDLEQNKWHTTTPITDGIYFVFYHREKNVRILGEYKNNEWYDRKGNKLDKSRVISWKLVELYVRSEDNEQN